METLLTEIPNTPIGWLALTSFGVFTIIQLVLLVRKNDVKTLNESNNYLREAVDDYKDKIDQLTLAVENLEKEVKRLKENNTFLQEIVSKSLAVYFEVNPTEVKNISTKLSR